MTKYAVSYEFKSNFSPVVVEVVCKDKEDAEKVFEERKNSGNCLKVKIIEIE